MLLEEELSLGSSGDNVKILQEKLKLLGYFNPIISGNFGKSTELGVLAFQKEYNLNQTGIVNQETWDKLFQLTDVATTFNTRYPTLSLNSTGEYVGQLQRKLRTLLYYTGEVTNVFDQETQTAVKRFQYHNDITTTGIVTDTVWEILNELYGNLNKCVTNEDLDQENDVYYTVKTGDTLYSIAKRFNTTVDEIKKLNNLTNNNLSIGQLLQIPKQNNENNNTNTNILYYPVVSKDTLYSIAKKFNTTVDSIKALNNLTSNTLSIGQILKIPSNNQYIYYTVTLGDNLYQIARKYNTTVANIISLNNLNSTTLTPGMVLKISTI